MIFLRAGVSTAFAAPIGGLLLAIEEGSSFLSLGLFWRGFLATCTGVITLHLLAQCHAGLSGIMHTKFGIWRDLGCACLCSAHAEQIHAELSFRHDEAQTVMYNMSALHPAWRLYLRRQPSCRKI